MAGQDISTERFEKLVLVHEEKLMNWFLRSTRDFDRAEELKQETFLRAWRFFDKFNRDNAWPWLLTIAKNLAINTYRSEIKGPVFQPLSSEDENLAIEIVSQESLPLEIRQALAALTDKSRVLIELYVAGYLYKEIAKILNCPIGTVMSGMFRARQ